MIIEELCPTCNGTGEIFYIIPGVRSLMPLFNVCPDCDGIKRLTTEYGTISDATGFTE